MNDSPTVESPAARECDCKVGRSARAYDLADVDAGLRSRRADGASLRDLEGVLNRAMLRRALDETDAPVVGGVDAVYEALVGDDVSAGRRAEVRARLDRAGVDVDALLDDFVSYATVRTHLRDCLGVDTDRTEPLSVADARGTIEWSRSRSEGIVERTLERLARRDDVDAGDLAVSHDVRVTCDDCGTTVPVERFLADGCDCGSPADESG